MAQFTVRNLEDQVRDQLKLRAVRHGTSLEAEVRDILRNAVKTDAQVPNQGLGSRIAGRFAKVGLTELLPELRGQPAMPAAFDAA